MFPFLKYLALLPPGSSQADVREALVRAVGSARIRVVSEEPFQAATSMGRRSVMVSVAQTSEGTMLRISPYLPGWAWAVFGVVLLIAAIVT